MADLKKIRQEIAEEYAAPHQHPWVIGFSGGKDSTLVTHLVFEHLLNIPRSQRTRDVHIVANDTLVESPLVVNHLREVTSDIREAAEAFGLPVTVTITSPEPDKSFWVNLIGRGYPPPNRTFRWCTDRMKIQPTSKYIRERASATGQVILLLGVRRTESATRASTVARYDNGERLNRHNDLIECMVFRPIVEMSTKEVWEVLALSDPPWGGSHARLIKLYSDATGGECPVMTQKNEVAACGTSSSRFGCWTCTVVDKDRSLEGFVESGFAEFGPLLDFRDWIASIRSDPSRRMARRRTGQVTITNDGVFVPGPFTPDTRREILKRLLKLQAEVAQPLITDEELDLIHSIWAEDAIIISKAATRELVPHRF
ncbi:DNA phosphorothioation system sulfurtransferase DndC [Methylobacterium mesophilicum SR1.6/6]|uniref:DNA phosphorothioation system sulfurtransferase DndC n=1 Tax=Methylobacterium mesophilicum SR1.6/6 TaxID=908290 RepID=A0A6B9FMM5_9HYPH|nr:DNA phosphorothioation system sulfurtransferase DndC [Methylobacterium mesophilicum]QGY03252.1 DNA phosphorothioation system sulfurtransferase DndC [Methylobacterium mesophilicum SR1.6/6]